MAGGQPSPTNSRCCEHSDKTTLADPACGLRTVRPRTTHQYGLRFHSLKGNTILAPCRTRLTASHQREQHVRARVRPGSRHATSAGRAVLACMVLQQPAAQPPPLWKEHVGTFDVLSHHHLVCATGEKLCDTPPHLHPCALAVTVQTPQRGSADDMRHAPGQCSGQLGRSTGEVAWGAHAWRALGGRQPATTTAEGYQQPNLT